jgi:hypothetical protein
MRKVRKSFEFQLMLLFLKFYLKEKNNEDQINDFIKLNNINWDKFQHLCRMHRLSSFIYQVIVGIENKSAISISSLMTPNKKLNSIKFSIPLTTVNTLRNSTFKNAKNAFKLYSENIKLRQLLISKNIPYVILKGPLFSERYFKNIGIRHAGDVDILISPNDLEYAVEILKNVGYEYNTKIPFYKQMKYKHHISLLNKKGIPLELHWRPFIYNYLFNLDIEKTSNYRHMTTDCKQEEVSINKSEMQSLPFEEYFIYLCIHGSKHNWFRLFWLFDIAALIEKQQIDWNKLLDKAKEYDVIRPVCEAIILSNIFFETDIPDDIKQLQITNYELRINYLVNSSIKCITEGCNITESGMLLKKISLFILRLKHNLRLRKSLKHKIDTLKVHLTHSKDWEVIPLPAPLFPLYFLLRPILFIIRNIKK